MDTVEAKLHVWLGQLVTSFDKAHRTTAYYLFEHSRELQQRSQLRKRYIKAIKPRVLNELSQSCGEVRSSQYVFASINVVSDDYGELACIPFNDNSREAYMPVDLFDSCIVTPLWPTPSNTLDNDWFIRFVADNLQEAGVPIEELIDILARKLDKSPTLLRQALDLTDPTAKVGVSAWPGLYCSTCQKYICLTHFVDQADEGVGQEELVTKRQTRKGKTIMKQVDPKHWKSGLYANEHNVQETGLWAAHFTCQSEDCYLKQPEEIPQLCMKTLHQLLAEGAPAEPSVLYGKYQLVKQLLSSSIRNPCFLALFTGLSCKESWVLLDYLGHLYKEPADPRILDETFQSRKVQKGSIANRFVIICQCSDECVPGQCPCLGSEHEQLRSVCDKCCECSSRCTQRFLGCDCPAGSCETSKCVCYVNHRKCDPDLCRQCASWAASHTALQCPGLCQNSVPRRWKRPRTVLGKSSQEGAGLGLFTLDNLKEHQLVMEYSGELIPDREQFIRASVYDCMEHSYIFGLTPDDRWAIDATFVGNKIRYINHRSHNLENCYCKLWTSDRNIKQLVFASKNIPRGSELFFNYSYDIRLVNYRWYLEYEAKLSRENEQSN